MKAVAVLFGVVFLLVSCCVGGIMMTGVMKFVSDNACGGGSEDQPNPTGEADRIIPATYLRLYQAAGQKYGLAWNVLAGIGYVESRHGRNPGVSSAGARGPMQFMPGTWAQYGVDGNGDGVRNIMDPFDAIPSAAHYLKVSGAPQNWEKAIWAYNHSHPYYRSVMDMARQYGGNDFAAGDDAACSFPDVGCGAKQGGSSPPVIGGTVGERIVAYAMSCIGLPYVWGGGDNYGPTHTCGHGFCGTGFDCSGLTKYAVYQATNGRISLQHYVPYQFGGAVVRVPYSQLQVGDLVAFNYYDHVGIYIGGGKMVNAPHTGAKVRVADISHGYYRSQFVTGGRVTVLGDLRFK